MSPALSPATITVAALVALGGACATRGGAGSDEHAGHAAAPAADTAATAAAAASASAAGEVVGRSGQSGAEQGTSLPAGAADAQARLAASPRHAEWVMVNAGGAGGADSVRAWVVYPERRTKAPVVVVIHEIFGLSPWIRAVADQLAADGFIAIAPDLLTAKNIPGSPQNPNPDSARAAIQSLDMNDVHRQILAVARYGMALPAALPRYGVVGFCWGGAQAFEHATRAPELGASVVYYGRSPEAEALRNVRAPILGLYGENDARVNPTVPPADSTLRALGKTFEHHTFPGAGHGFLRAQDGQAGQNLSATREAWPRTVAWFRKYLGA
jgi:carboxymethylenebutenolidase